MVMDAWMAMKWGSKSVNIKLCKHGGTNESDAREWLREGIDESIDKNNYMRQ